MNEGGSVRDVETTTLKVPLLATAWICRTSLIGLAYFSAHWCAS